jgi:DNA (cytosine-5)-methyltransferase 1
VSKALKVLDLFSGIGGFSLGLERAGMETVAFCEVSPKCRHLLKHHWPEVPQYDDVCTLTAERLAADGIAVDVICGGFPCQDISLNGDGAGIEGARSGLWREFARLICEIRPGVVVVENVSAIVNRGLSTVLGDLASLGYDAWWDCARASNFGAPQLRDRFWCVAYSEGGEAGEQIARNCHRVFEEARAEQASQAGGRAGLLGGHDWSPEPAICRVVDGVSVNVDRVSVLGNAVIPEIPYRIGRAILQARAA